MRKSLDAPTEDVPVEVEDRLARTFADIHDDLVILEARAPRGLGEELEHAPGFVGRELADLAERRHMPLGQDQQVRLRPGMDVADCDEPVGLGDVVALLDEPAEETVLRQRGSPPP